MRYPLLLLLLLLALTSWYRRKAAIKQESGIGRPQGTIGWSLFIGCLAMLVWTFVRLYRDFIH
jgi:hypothetical protein